MPDPIAELQAKLDRLVDKEAIRELLTSIARGIDRYDQALLTASIGADAVIDMGGEATLSGAAFVANLRPPAEPPAGRMHLLANHWIEVAGDAARSESHIVSCQQVSTPDGAATRFRAGRYLDRFERRGDAWMLVSRTLVDEWGRADPVKEATPRGRHGGRPAPGDLVYERTRLGQ